MNVDQESRVRISDLGLRFTHALGAAAEASGWVLTWEEVLAGALLIQESAVGHLLTEQRAVRKEDGD